MDLDLSKSIAGHRLPHTEGKDHPVDLELKCGKHDECPKHCRLLSIRKLPLKMTIHIIQVTGLALILYTYRKFLHREFY